MEVHHHPHVEKKNFKEYFLEFLMIFLAVTMGFFAENLREHLTDSGKEKVYMESMVKDLKNDTAGATQTLAFQHVLFKKIDSALKIPVTSLRDINAQDSFYHYFVFFYSWIVPFTRNDNTITQLKNAGDFSIIENKTVVDSIIDLNSFYDGELNLNKGIYTSRWQRLDEFAMQLIVLPEPPSDIMNSIYYAYPANEEMFTRYDLPMLQQLYSFMRMEQSDLEINMVDESTYKNKSMHLIKLIQAKYHLQ